MKKRTKITLISLGCVISALIPFLLIAEFGNDPTNYQEDYIESLEPIEIRHLEIVKSKENITFYKEDDTDFKILQLSDIHFVGANMYKSLDLKALQAVYTMVNDVRPDLIIYTGDIIFPTLFFGSNNNIKAAQILSMFFEKMQVPFAYEFGNHDTEHYATGNAHIINAIFQDNPYCVAKEDEAVTFKSGRLSQVIEVRNSDNTINQAIILLDSGDYENGTSMASGYGNFTEAQIYWYATKIERIMRFDKLADFSNVPSMCFFHIPLYEYQVAYTLYENGFTEVDYLYGKNDEKISCPSKSSGIFQKMVELNSTKALFFGHDHMNNMALRYQGIEMYYGQSIDYRAYPTIKYKDQYRGGVIINLHADSTYTVTPRLLRDIK